MPQRHTDSFLVQGLKGEDFTNSVIEQLSKGTDSNENIVDHVSVCDLSLNVCEGIAKARDASVDTESSLTLNENNPIEENTSEAGVVEVEMPNLMDKKSKLICDSQEAYYNRDCECQCQNQLIDEISGLKTKIYILHSSVNSFKTYNSK